MIKPAQYRRLALLALMLVVAFAGLGYRLVSLQVTRHDEFVSRATLLQRQKVLRASQRGDILDANGHPLATTVFVKTVVADPFLIGTNQALVARQLAPVLNLDEAFLIDRLQIRKYMDRDGQERTRRSVVLKRRVAFDDWEKVRAAMTNLNVGVDVRKMGRRERLDYYNLTRKAISVEAMDDQMRVYPSKSLAAHVIGHVVSDDKKVDGLAATYLRGVDGIESKFDPVLNGVVGWKQTETDARKEELVVFRKEDVSSRPGLDVVLTLDSTVQSIVETELAAAMAKHLPTSASAVIVRPKTGQIVAMATLPNYDPNQPGRGLSPSVASPGVATGGGVDPNQQGNDKELGNLRNRVITDMFEPGSTFKTVVISGAFNEGLVGLNDHFFCENGAFRFADRVLHDAGHHFNDLSVEEIIARSSNIGAAKVGLKMGPNVVDHYIRRFGFGERTGILLPGEVRGSVRPVTNWSKVSIVQIPMGQGIAVTPLQMTMAISAVANGGRRLMRPMMVDRVVGRVVGRLSDDQEKEVVMKKYEPEPIRQVITPAAARLMVQAMKRAVSTNGTAIKAQLLHYTVAGKTGTAEKPPYKNNKYFSSFIGFLPADNPEICIGVFVDQPQRNGYYGADTAAPVFQRIAERAAVQLGIRPDLVAPEDVVPSVVEAYSDAVPVKASTGRTQGNF